MGFFNTRPRLDDKQVKQLSGDTITLSGVTNIDGTFRYKPGAVTGNFLKASDPQGTLEWAPISAVTWSISACTSPLYVTTIEACPNPTDPLYITAGNVQFGSSPSLIADIANTRLGIGIGSPTERLHIEGGNALIEYGQDASTRLDVKNYNGGNDAFAQFALSVSGTSTSNSKFGSIIAIGPDSIPTGSFMGSYLPDSLNIITANGSAATRMHINIGSRRTNGETRFFSGEDFDVSNLVGVVYSTGLTITDMVNTNTLRVRNGATSGYVLTSDSSGNATWQASTASGGTGGVTIDPYEDVGSVNAITWDVSGTSTNYEAILTGNTTLNLTNVRNGDYGTLIVTQDGVGSHTLTFGAGAHRVVNGGGGAPTLTATAGATDILSFTYNGTRFYWTVGNDYT